MHRTQEARRAETRTRLLEAAAILFARYGVDAVSVDAVAETAGRTSGSVYDHFGSKQGLLLALLDSWKGPLLTTLLAEVTVAGSPADQLTAVWEAVSRSDDDDDDWALLEHELWLRAARDPEVADVVRIREQQGRRFSASLLASWSGVVGAQPVAEPEDLAVLVKALLTGLALQQRLDPASVNSHAASAGLAALLGLPSLNPLTAEHTKSDTVTDSREGVPHEH